MERVGLDTSTLIDASKGKPHAAQAVKGRNTAIAELVVCEFLQGNLTMEEEERFLRQIQALPAYEFNRKAARIAAHEHRKAIRKGTTRPAMDLAIAASYLAAGINTIITRNPKDFQGIEGLKVITY